MTDTEVSTRKRRIRAGHKASATRTLGQLAVALGETHPNPDRLSLLQQTLEQKLETLKGLDTEIIELTPEETLDDEIQQADDYRERIYEALTRIKRAEPTATAPGIVPPTATRGPERGARVQLPKLTLPHFNGDLMKWPTFWDSYESAIHNNDGLTDTDKFNYLRSLVERTAYDAISGLTLSSVNYQEAIEILQKRFGNKLLIISKHMETLLTVEAVTSDQNLKDLRRLYDSTESHMRSLKSLGVESESYGAMLSSVLLTKLPTDLRLIVSRKVASTDLNMDSLLKPFEEELVARERASNSNSNSFHTPPRRNQDRGRQTSSALLSRAQEPRAGVSCSYCQQSHPSTDCKTVISLTARKQTLRDSGRCFNCLRKGHMGRNCRSTSKCLKCKGRHHTSICEREVAELNPRPHTVQPETTLSPDATPYTPTLANNALCSDKGNAILLQTARSIVHNPAKSETSIEVRLLFDSGSQKSYITERAKNLLALEPSGEQLLSIATFGSNREQAKVCTIVNVGMCLKGYPPMSLSLYVVPTICGPLVGQHITTCFENTQQFMGLDFADYSDGRSSLEVDVLIGSDYYWDLVTGSVCRSEGGPTAIHTKLGWVLSGPTPAKDQAQCSMNLTTTHVLRAETQELESTALDEQLRSFWELKSLGINKEEKTLYDEFASDITFHEGRYKVSLPWKEFHDPLPDNYQLSLKRMRGMLC
ncbi:uncharacterized protein LOC135336735 [Halichondria panicea]|uniref:uncharacterized protein LOC135336735 n=1 Tax=Halichondria panicea TaxID=6063 RepID=UPI00312BB772